MKNEIVVTLDKETNRIVRVVKYINGKEIELPSEKIAEVQKAQDELAKHFDSLPEGLKLSFCPNYGHWEAMIKAYGVEVKE